MHRLLQFFFLFGILFTSNQLMSQAPLKNPDLMQPKLMQPAIFDSNEPAEVAHPTTPIIPKTNDRTEAEVLIGTTIYDLQTNYSSMPRLVNYDGGKISAVWTMGFDAAGGYPNRGTGYAHFDGTSWNDNPSSRLESGVRTGWPAILATDNNDEVVINHVFAAPFNLHELRKQSGTDFWVESDVPNGTPSGVVWPRIAKGGLDGNTIHAVALTTPSGNGGAVYDGVDGHLLYYRSTNGGLSWDILDQKLPGLDMTEMVSLSADAYAIDAQGENVLVTVFGQWSDVAVWKSGDNGATWNRIVVNDFPLTNYVTDAGYTIDDLPPYNPAQPDSLAILTSDYSGAAILDNDGKAHVFFGEMYVIDDDLADGGTQYYPASSGIRYWNESFGQDSTQTIADIIDTDGNGTFDIPDAASVSAYFTSMTSFPSVGINEANQLFLAYSGVVEEYFKEDANPNLQHYRHIFTIASPDGGETWTEPIDLINEEISSDADLIPAIEAVFPSVARHVDDKVHLIWQFDFEPGMAVRGDSDPAETNFISYVGFDVADYGNVDLVDSKEAILNEASLNISPNPTSSLVQIQLELEETAKVEYSLLNMMGQVTETQDLGRLTAGLFSTEMNLNRVPKGVYLLKVKIGNETISRKIIKQ